jgi:nucleoid-associated protein YgaU
MTPSQPSHLGATPPQPVAPVVRVTPSQPTAPARTAPAAPATLNSVIVKPGDSLWKLAEQNLGKGLLWHELLAVNPGIEDADRIVAGTQIFLPSLVSTAHAAARFTVRKGDTLSEIALTQLGRASSWACIAQANPTIQDANLIFEGQLLVLPASCKRQNSSLSKRPSDVL